MLLSARAQVDQKKAALVQAQVDLEHTTIRAPVNGVVVSRAVDVGQTVAASLQAPMLFTIAEDLTKMQVEVSVDEADIGRIRLEDRATFTVDSFPGQTFAGVVTQIRKAAQVVQNVVTYTVVVAVDNPGGRLLPGMTANAKMIVAEKPSVLKIPNAALRFRPAGTDGAPAAGAPAVRPRGQLAADGAGPRWRRARRRSVAAADGPRSSRSASGSSRASSSREEQQKKLDPILQDSRQQMQALREAARRASASSAASKIREATRLRIREILTPEQQARYDESAGRRWRRAAASPERLAGPRVDRGRREAQARPAHARHQRRLGDRDPARRPRGGPGRSSSAPPARAARPAGGQGPGAPRPRL